MRDERERRIGLLAVFQFVLKGHDLLGLFAPVEAVEGTSDDVQVVLFIGM